ncbi:MAG: ABC transporter permease [Candidatus Bathyarchaeia archaeon]
MSGRSGFSELWSRYRRSRLGLVGLAILLFFLSTALLAPVLTPYHPVEDKYLAEGIALPAWYRLLPGYSDLPETTVFHVAARIDAENWQARVEGPITVSEGEALILDYDAPAESAETGAVELLHSISYQAAPPSSFQVATDLNPTDMVNSVYEIQMLILDPDSHQFLIWSSGPETGPLEPSQLRIDSKGLPFEYKSRMGLEWYQNVAEHVFSKKGDYRLLLRFQVKPVESTLTSRMHISVSNLDLHIPGRVHGLLGTDHLGSDLLSQLLYGARISLIIGVSAAALAVSIGLAVGLVSGYRAGITDEALMRLVDLLLVLPGLPLLMILSGLFGRNVWNTVLLLGILSWPGFARVVRAQVLQLKTAAFVEASRAIGASDLHIILKHLLPNVLPLAYATVALYIPGAVITEAALSFLALGDPNTPSWGRIFYSANAFGAFQHLAWWWIIPPGVAITLLSISFVFIGTTLDEILNPKIRARR